MIWQKVSNTAVSTSALILPQEEGKVGFIVLYKVGFIGCDRLITSLTLELRWRVKAGDKGVDEEGCNFFLCVRMCERVDVCLLEPGLESRNPQGTKVRTGLGLQRLNAVLLSLTEKHRPTSRVAGDWEGLDVTRTGGTGWWYTFFQMTHYYKDGTNHQSLNIEISLFHDTAEMWAKLDRSLFWFMHT